MTKEDKPDAWMPLYIGDWDGDTGHLTNEQDGAYGRLIRWYWRNGPIPDNETALASLIRSDLRTWRRLRPVLSSFFVIEGGFWRHKRVDAELSRWAQKKVKAVERAQTAAAARWGNEAPVKRPRKNAKSNATSMPQALLVHCPSSSSSEVEDPKGSSTLRGRGLGERADGSPVPLRFVEFVEEAIATKGRDWAASWLGDVQWQEVPDKALICDRRVQAKTIKGELRKLLTKHGIAVRTVAVAGAA